MKKLLLSIATIAITANAASLLSINNSEINNLKQEAVNNPYPGMNLITYSTLTGGLKKAIVTFTATRSKNILDEHNKSGKDAALLLLYKFLIPTKLLSINGTDIKITAFAKDMQKIVSAKYTDFINLLNNAETLKYGFTMEVRKATALTSWAFVNTNTPFHTTKPAAQAKDAAAYGVNSIGYDSIPLIQEFTKIRLNNATLNSITSATTREQLVSLFQDSSKFFYNSLNSFSENVISSTILTPIASLILKNIDEIKQYNSNNFGIIVSFSKLTLGSWNIGETTAQDMSDN